MKMIYQSVPLEDDIRQGDIFINLPFIYANLEELNVYNTETTFRQISIDQIEEKEGSILTLFEKMDFSIVLSQDCDCLRSPFISLIVITEWERNIRSHKSWMNEIIKLNDDSPYRMYLPPEEDFNIIKRMFIDFSLIFYARRENLENLRTLRICRLNIEAMEHYREKLAYYFHRYAYTEYYPPNRKEMDEYEKWRKKKYERRIYQR